MALTYWEKRAEQLFNAQDKQNAKLEKKLQKEYLRVEEQLNKEIAAYYQKYGKNNVIEFRKLVQSLSESERTLLYQNYEAFAQKYPQYINLMPIRESIYKLNRLEGLQLSIHMQLLELGAIEQIEFERLLHEAYERGFMSIMNGLHNAPSFFGINNFMLEKTINEKWIDGKNFSDRIWDNKMALLKFLNTEIRDGMIRGLTYDKLSKVLSDRMNVGHNAAKRLIATETAFIMNQANKQAFMDAGVERYELTAVLDHRTSPICREMNGKVFKFEEAKVGINFPPFHPWCRTTHVPVENDVEDINSMLLR